MFRSKTALSLVALAALTLPAAAQSTDLLERATGVRTSERLAPLATETLASDLAPEELQAMFEANPNLFVAVVETLLGEEGLLPDGRVRGVLTRPVLAAMLTFCGNAGIAAQCLAAPLSPETMLAIGKVVAARGDGPVPDTAQAPAAVAAEPAASAPEPAAAVAEPAAAVAAESAAEPKPEPAAAAIATEEVAPGWVIRHSTALTVETAALDDDTYELSFTGVAATRDYVAFFPLEFAMAGPGQAWETQVDGRVVDDGGPEVRLRGQLAGGPSTSYLGELHDGEVIPVAEDLAPLSRSGTIEAEGVSAVRPYIQFWHNPNEQIDLTIIVTLPRIEAVTSAEKPSSSD